MKQLTRVWPARLFLGLSPDAILFFIAAVATWASKTKSVVENLEFADYDSLEDCCRDYARLITNTAPYRAAWEPYHKAHDPPSLVAAVARVYATDRVPNELGTGNYRRMPA